MSGLGLGGEPAQMAQRAPMTTYLTGTVGIKRAWSMCPQNSSKEAQHCPLQMKDLGGMEKKDLTFTEHLLQVRHHCFFEPTQ